MWTVAENAGLWLHAAGSYLSYFDFGVVLYVFLGEKHIFCEIITNSTVSMTMVIARGLFCCIEDRIARGVGLRMEEMVAISCQFGTREL